ncbi:MAG: hypothetical protein ACI9S8_000952 [Chlamydiales bacterium]|jgi:hypothetical protein
MTVSLPGKATIYKPDELYRLEDGSCVICLLPLREGDQRVISLACSHFYHLNCLKGWAKAESDRITASQNKQSSGLSCPLCRDTKGLSGRQFSNFTRRHRWERSLKRIGACTAYLLLHVAELGTVALGSERLITYPSRAKVEEGDYEEELARLGGVFLGLAYLALYLFQIIKRIEEEDRPLPPIVHYSQELCEGVRDCFEKSVARVHTQESRVEEV